MLLAFASRDNSDVPKLMADLFYNLRDVNPTIGRSLVKYMEDALSLLETEGDISTRVWPPLSPMAQEMAGHANPRILGLMQSVFTSVCDAESIVSTYLAKHILGALELLDHSSNDPILPGQAPVKVTLAPTPPTSASHPTTSVATATPASPAHYMDILRIDELIRTTPEIQTPPSSKLVHTTI